MIAIVKAFLKVFFSGCPCVSSPHLRASVVIPHANLGGAIHTTSSDGLFL